MDLKFKRIKEEFCVDQYPTLAEAVDRIKGLTTEQKEMVLGLGVEIAIQGNCLAIFEDEFDLDLNDNDEF